ncbi:sugar ABC transporter ATP-binding protein [Microbacterium sp. Au-Mic1]|uniref:sugar ABC transporter ATP-binding protein n=1 Tax=Microbacterium sp. Au-Mic1 TaxID=2906457 RepID=UPI001E45765C|nr:sugar ABC transporter ATP-binding protein [Microbacterium sp. Au-Mic1]MCE4026260.1 sugar ABC transporter ATP-binding protein [Microbacterium sp. Au-Mic1]
MTDSSSPTQEWVPETNGHRAGSSRTAPEVVLSVDGIGKRYGGVHALRGVGFDLHRGEVLALAGHNGAGKSTLIGILAGTKAADMGRISVDGAERSFADPGAAREAGIGVCYQEPTLVSQLTVAANVFLKLERRDRFGRMDRLDLRTRYSQLQQKTGIELPGDALVADLSVAQKQLAQILRALAGGARIVILDEPTAALSPSDRTQLFDLIRKLREGDEPVSFIIVSHFLEELEDNCDRAVVLRNGAVVATIEKRPSAKQLAKLMAGSELDALEHAPVVRVAPGTELLRLDSLAVNGAPPIDLRVHAHEIVGLAGLIGSGRTELLRSIALGYGRDGGDARVRGLSVRNGRQALKHGLAMLSESRKDALIGDWPIWKNVTLPGLERLSGRIFVHPVREKRSARSLIERCRVIAAGIGQWVGDLSGGNQQKVVFAKLLASNFSVGLLDEPTHGVDIHAKAEIFSIIDELAAEGRAFIVVAAEFEDLLRMSTRILTIYKGSVIAEHPISGVNDPVTAEQLLYEAATGRRYSTSVEGDRS